MAPNIGVSSAAADVDVAQAEAPRFEKVYWTREPHLRKLYAMAVVLMVASATTGYDGSLVNTSQQIQMWERFFGKDVQDDSKLGILVNMFNIGSIFSFFITPHVADNYGRKTAIFIGCWFMVVGGCLTAFCNGYGSELYYLAWKGRLVNSSKSIELTCCSVHGRSLRSGLRQLARSDGLASASH
jgi:hypothetical protein